MMVSRTLCSATTRASTFITPNRIEAGDSCGIGSAGRNWLVRLGILYLGLGRELKSRSRAAQFEGTVKTCSCSNAVEGLYSIKSLERSLLNAPMWRTTQSLFIHLRTCASRYALSRYAWKLQRMNAQRASAPHSGISSAETRRVHRGSSCGEMVSAESWKEW